MKNPRCYRFCMKNLRCYRRNSRCRFCMKNCYYRKNYFLPNSCYGCCYCCRSVVSCFEDGYSFLRCCWMSGLWDGYRYYR